MQTVYLLFFVSVFELSYLLNRKVNTMNLPLFIILSFILLLDFSLFCGLRYNVGIDYMNYYHSITKNTYKNIQLTGSQFEAGYIFICDFISVLRLPPHSLFIIFAFLTNLFLFLGIRNYSSNVTLSFFVYFSNGIFFNTFNVMRQFLAVMIGFYAVKFIIEKNIYRFVFLVFVASLFHKSALLLLPFYFLFRIKVPRFIVFLLLIVSIVIKNINGIELLQFIISIFPTPYNSYSDTIGVFMTNDGSGFISYILLSIALYLTSNSYDLCTNKKNLVFYNSFIFATFFLNGFYQFFLVTRAMEYFLPSLCIMFPLFYSQTKKTMKGYVFFIGIFLALAANIIKYVYFLPKESLLQYRTIFSAGL
jgi:hypothetical protein